MERKAIICVIVRKDATAHDIFQSFFHALVTAYVPDQASRHLESLSWMDKHYEDFIQKVFFFFFSFFSLMFLNFIKLQNFSSFLLFLAFSFWL